jgi:hypothetical protein
MTRISALALILCLAPLTLPAQPAPKAPAAPKAAPADTSLHQLPVRQVILYKNGVGYFQHTGQVTGNQHVAIDFTSAQLNDVLQSLTVLDLGGGHIAGVNYNSTTPLSEQLKALSLGMTDDPNSTELFQALRGQRVEVTGAPGGSITGRLMSIETRTTQPDPTTDSTARPAQDRYYLTLVANSGAVRVIELTPALSVRPLDPALQSEMDRYLEMLAGNHSTGLRHLTLNALGVGLRTLSVSYISEVPVWKSTYRIVFPKEATGNAIVQGWAVVDNTVGSDWDNVQLSLVAGAPQSFIQPLSQPLYIRRPEIPIATTEMTTPQTHEAANTAQEQVTVNADAMQVNSAPVAKARSFGVAGMEGLGGTASHGAIGGLISNRNFAALAAPPPIYEPTDATTDVSTNAFDDFFEYALAQPVTIHKNESAMVPILQETLPAEHVTLWNPAENLPFRAIWLENSSKLTLDGGSFSVFTSGAFAGEGLLDPIHPGEKRLLSYAADQAIRVRIPKSSSESVLRRVHIGPQGFLTRVWATQSRETYEVTNSADEPRTVVLEIPRKHNRTLAPDLKPAETAPGLYRFRLTVEAHKNATLPFADEGLDESSWKLSPDTNQTDQIEQVIRDIVGKQTDGQPGPETIAPQLIAALRSVEQAQQAIQQLKSQLHDLDTKSGVLSNDESRARDNLTALKGNEAAKRFIDALNRAEDGLEENRKQSADLNAKLTADTDTLRQTITSLNIDWTHPVKSAQ